MKNGQSLKSICWYFSRKSKINTKLSKIDLYEFERKSRKTLWFQNFFTFVTEYQESNCHQQKSKPILKLNGVSKSQSRIMRKITNQNLFFWGFGRKIHASQILKKSHILKRFWKSQHNVALQSVVSLPKSENFEVLCL